MEQFGAGDGLAYLAATRPVGQATAQHRESQSPGATCVCTSHFPRFLAANWLALQRVRRARPCRRTRHWWGDKVWFSEINISVAQVFSHDWSDAPNLGDISVIDWSTVPPVEIVISGFPCQGVSIVGKGAGIAPGTRSGLWSCMARAIEEL
ncbi:DNA cytosine methyltransferase [Kocuria rhizophila]|uniref:DNA cytosine methyltransferase n=1 Tax=Kocuria rhizophila TaxID=72000 RepID=UPI00399B21FE